MITLEKWISSRDYGSILIMDRLFCGFIPSSISESWGGILKAKFVKGKEDAEGDQIRSDEDLFVCVY